MQWWTVEEPKGSETFEKSSNNICQSQRGDWSMLELGQQPLLAASGGMHEHHIPLSFWRMPSLSVASLSQLGAVAQSAADLAGQQLLEDLPRVKEHILRNKCVQLAHLYFLWLWQLGNYISDKY